MCIKQGEPVAWMFKSPLGFKKLQENKPIFGANELQIGWSALYTSAPTMLTEQAPCDIPEGWQLVPITPDWNMQMEGIRKLEHCTNGELECIGEKLLDSLIKHTSEIYKAMLAAAPKPEE